MESQKHALGQALIYSLISLAVYNLVPCYNMVVEDSSLYIFLTDLMILNPVYSFAFSLFNGVKYGLRLWVSLTVSLPFVVPALWYYNDSALIYLLAYLLLALLGNVIGAIIHRSKGRSGQN